MEVFDDVEFGRASRCDFRNARVNPFGVNLFGVDPGLQHAIMPAKCNLPSFLLTDFMPESESLIPQIPELPGPLLGQDCTACDIGKRIVHCIALLLSKASIKVISLPVCISASGACGIHTVAVLPL